MKLTIDNLDYTPALDTERPPHLTRRLNRPSEMRAYVYACDAQFVVPASGARVVLARNNGASVFTGYLTSAPGYEYLGWGERGPEYRYVLRAESDESLLATKTLPERPAFVGRTAGAILATLANDAAHGALDTAGCDDVLTLPAYVADPRRRFDEHAAELGLRARAAYRAQDGRLFLRPIGAVEHTLDDSAPAFCPEGLKLEPTDSLINDAILAGAIEPAAFVKDYFLGDGYSLAYSLSETPFLRPGTVLVEEEYRGTTIRPEYWTVADPAGVIAASQGKLRVSGGTGALGATFMKLTEPVELGGGLVLDHGEFEITGAADALAGGLYSGTFDIAGCVLGFRLTPSSGAATQIAAVVNGSASGQTITTAPGRRYALTTRIYASEVFRQSQVFATESGPLGGMPIPSVARVILQVREIDPNDAASLVAPATVLYEGWLPDVSTCCAYALINAAALQASVAYTRLARVADAEIRTCTFFGNWRNRLAGAMSEGAECRLSASQLYFYPASAPEQGERIVVSYRSAARAMARVIDESSIAAKAHGIDDGHRAVVASVASPQPRTSDDCENAALALLRTASQPGWTGEYETWSEFLEDELLPGDELTIRVPSRNAEFTAIVREVAIEAADLADDRSRYHIKFATESAEPLAMHLDSAPQLRLPENASTLTSVGTQFLPPIAAAEIVDIGSTSVMIDAGADPASGGGFEVRRSDTGWGLENDRNLVGRFDHRILTVPRTSRSQTWYLRPYDGAGRYSRFSTVLHVDIPL